MFFCSKFSVLLRVVLGGDDYSPSGWLQCNGKNQHLNILSTYNILVYTLIVKGATRRNMLKGKLNEMSIICFTDILVTFLKPFQSIKIYKDFTL